MKFFVLLVFSMSALAGIDCQKARRDYYHGRVESIPQQCGAPPDDSWLKPWTSECARVSTLVNKNLATWNSSGTWAAESTCEALERGDEF